MSPHTLTTIPTELLTSIFEYFVDDVETLKYLSKAHPKLALQADEVRQSIQRVLVRGNGAQHVCEEFVKFLRRNEDETRSGNALIGPIRYLELTFDSRAQFRLADATQEVLDLLPAVRHVTLKLTARPFPDSQYANAIENLEEKVRGTIQDYASLMDMLNTLKPQRKIGLSLVLNDCMLRSSPVIAQQYENIILREFDIKYYVCNRWSINDLTTHLAYAKDTLTALTILEDDENSWYEGQDRRIDFSVCTALKRLQIPASLWFDEAAYGTPGIIEPIKQGFLWKFGDTTRPSVIHLLPPSLSSLRVDLVGGACLFAVGMGYRAMFSHMTSDEAKMRMKPAWNWIHELATVDASQFPHLESVEVLEGLGAVDSRGRPRREDQSNSDTIVDWDPPLELKKAFEDRGIKLKIQTRALQIMMSGRPERNESSVFAA